MRAGAELVLSVNSSNRQAACDWGCEVVVIPDDFATLGGLDETVELLAAAGVPVRIDPILEPIGCGFAASLGRLGKRLVKVLNSPVRQIGAAVLCLMLVGGVIGIASLGINGGSSGAAATEDLRVQAVEIGQLSSSIGATGQVRAGQSATLGWQTSGIVEVVNVTEGQEVVDGELLAYLEQGSLPQSVINAQSDFPLETEEFRIILSNFYFVCKKSSHIGSTMELMRRHPTTQILRE